VAELNGSAALPYDDAGEGSPAFVFVHGAGGARDDWAEQVADLSRDYRCLSVAVPQDIETVADGVSSLLSKLRPGPVIAVGHGAGALTVLVLVERYPEAVVGVVLIDPPLPSGAIPHAAGDVRLSEEAAGVQERAEVLAKLADKKPFMVLWPEHPAGLPAWFRDVTMFVRQEPIPGASHYVQKDEPALTNALLRAFVDDVTGDPRLNNSG
jgi:pimeloyl-ACP methyl ester carboxylesterase